MVNRSKNVGDLVSKKTEFGEVRPHNFRLKPIARVLGTCALGLGFGLAHSVTQAATITVNNSADLGVGCTLRDAIVSLNLESLQAGCAQTDPFGTDDTVNFASAMTIVLTAGPLLINAPEITIDASTVSGVTIDGNNNSGVLRVNSYSGEAGSLTIDSLTITGGSAYLGGGIYGGENSTIEVLNSTISSNTATGSGGGIHSKGGLTVKYSDISNNQAVTDGGGVALQAQVAKYSSSILDSTISNNVAGGNGGGIDISAAVSGGEAGPTITMPSRISLEDATISNNTASNGGGLSSYGSLVLVTDKYSNQINSSISNNTATLSGGGVFAESIPESEGEGYSIFGVLTNDYSSVANNNTVLTVSNNTAGADGGGIYIGSITTLALIRATVSGNSATGDGGGILIDEGTERTVDEDLKYSQGYIIQSTISSNISGGEGGGIRHENSETQIDSSTISNNIANYGGGVMNVTGELTVTNSTVSGNTASRWGSGIYAKYALGTTLTNSTVSNNRLLITGYGAAGVYAFNSVSSAIENSIVANSVGGFIDCSGFSVDAFSIVEDGSCSATRSGDPGLGPLTNNGGLTQTHLPRENSIAINTGDNTTCSAALGGEFDPGDQRGEVRPLTTADACDVGSVEFKDSDITSFYVIPLQNGKVVVIPL